MVSNFSNLEEKTQVCVSKKLSKCKANNYTENYTSAHYNLLKASYKQKILKVATKKWHIKENSR